MRGAGQYVVKLVLAHNKLQGLPHDMHKLVRHLHLLRIAWRVRHERAPLACESAAEMRLTVGCGFGDGGRSLLTSSRALSSRFSTWVGISGTSTDSRKSLVRC